MRRALVAFAAVGVVSLGIAVAQERAPARNQKLEVAPVVTEEQSTHRSQQGVSIHEALVKKLHKSNEAEIELAKIAMQRSKNKEVKSLAEHLVHDHEIMNQNLEKVKMQKSSSNAMIPHEFCEIGEKACENALAMTKEMLMKHEGQDFDMAFLGHQCVAHTMTLAELKAIESTGPAELKQTAKDAADVVKEHLAAVKELAKTLQDDRKAPNS